MRTISPTLARRMAITRQRLAGPRPTADSEGIMDVMRNIGYIQLDPMRVVAPSHLLVLWSRLGKYDSAHLDTLLWRERRLFEDWAQTTSIVPMEDYPIFRGIKRGFATGDQPWAQRIRSWIEKNKKLRQHILTQLRGNGPLRSDRFKDKSVESWHSTGWTAGRNVDMMLRFLWAEGRIMVAGREGGRKLWELTERWLPEGTPQKPLSDHEILRSVAQKSLRALGVGTVGQIKQHYIRGYCSNAADVLSELEARKLVTRVEIDGNGRLRRGPWYVHAEDLSLLDRLAAGEWEPRMTLLSPFDNLICDRKRTERLFDFHFRFEVYTPKSKRRFGCYVMPILSGDRFIGRVDPVMDRKQSRLLINAVHAEPDAPRSKETAVAVDNTIRELADFLGADEVHYCPRVPGDWKSVLR